MRKLGEGVTEMLEIMPRQWKVIQHVREFLLPRELRASRGADGGSYLVSVLREGRKGANTRSSSGIIWGIPVGL